MSRMWQVFSGPDELEALPEDGHVSPWSFPSQVRLPMEHWEAIIAFAQSRDAAEAALLEQVSFLDGTPLHAETEARFLLLLETLAKAVVLAGPLTPEGADPAVIPEPMPNTSHAEMLSDIARLMHRTQALGMSVDSWVD
ncbi:MAG: hypothetical protein P1U83_15990 [Roseovarius sp.]|nr:hypothetical protein [Roseovarius sp.]